MPHRQLSTITKAGLFGINISTPNILSHSIMTDNYEAWEKICKYIQVVMSELAKNVEPK